MASTTDKDDAYRAGRYVERRIRAWKPKTRRGEFVVKIAAPIGREVTVRAVRFAEEKGPELLATGAEKVKETLPVVAKRARTQAGQLRARVRERRSKGETRSEETTPGKPDVREVSREP